LEKVAGFFGCPTDNWHNAAWDAEYTLKAMVAIVVETASTRTFGSTGKKDMQEYFERPAQRSSQVTIHITGYETPRCGGPLWLREMITTTLNRNKNLLIVERSPKIVAKVSAKLFSYGISHGYSYGHGYRYDPMDSGLQAAYESNFNSGINRIMIVDTERLQHITAAVSQIVVPDFAGIGDYQAQSPGGYVQALIDQIKRPGCHTDLYVSIWPSGDEWGYHVTALVEALAMNGQEIPQWLNESMWNTRSLPYGDPDHLRPHLIKLLDEDT